MNFNKKLAVAVSSAVLLMAGQVALADSATDIVDALVSKGVLTEEEGKLITKGHTSKTSVTPVVKEKDGAFTLESANARNSISLTGRMHLDYRDSDIDGSLGAAASTDRDTASMTDQFELRRARIGVKGKLAKDFKYEIVTNIPGTATVDVAYLDFARYEQVQLRAGKFKQPFGLEQLISSNNITMLERSYVDQTVPGKKLGLQVMGTPFTGTTYAGSIFQNNDTELNISADGKSSFAGRGTINFAELMGNKEMIMHVGLSGIDNSYALNASSSSQTTSVADDTTLRGTISSFRSAGRGMNNIFRGQVASATPCFTADYNCRSEVPLSVNQRAIGLEGIFATGPFKLMGEYSDGRYKGTGDGETKYDTKTYFVEAGWFITGEKYASSYKNGVFSSFKPTNEFDLDKGHYGAIELAFRAEAFEVDNISITGGLAAGRVQGALSSYTGSANNTSSTGVGVSSGANTYTTGVRWILNSNIVLKANYAYSKFDHAFAPIDVVGAGLIKDEKLLMFRTQYMF